MLGRFEVEVEDCASKIAIDDVTMTKTGKETKFHIERLKTVVSSAIKWTTSLRWVEDDAKRAKRAWTTLKENIGKFPSI